MSRTLSCIALLTFTLVCTGLAIQLATAREGGDQERGALHLQLHSITPYARSVQISGVHRSLTRDEWDALQHLDAVTDRDVKFVVLQLTITNNTEHDVLLCQTSFVEQALQHGIRLMDPESGRWHLARDVIHRGMDDLFTLPVLQGERTMVYRPGEYRLIYTDDEAEPIIATRPGEPVPRVFPDTIDYSLEEGATINARPILEDGTLGDRIAVPVTGSGRVRVSPHGPT